MDQLTTKAIARAIQQLVNLGCKCKVERDGEILYDTLPAPVAPKKPRAKVAHLYRDQIKAMQPGELRAFPVPAECTAEGWQKILSGAGVYMFGKGACMTEIVADHSAVNVLRVD